MARADQSSSPCGRIWRDVPNQRCADPRLREAAVTRARLSKTPAVVWLDPQRSHDAGLIKKK